MIVYRITGSKHAIDLSGTGAALYGGRWNKKGTPVIYTGESKEIALLELIVHSPPMIIPDLEIITLEIPDNSITELKQDQLPDNWIDYPAPAILAEIGEEWVVLGSTIAIKVPSCIIQSANNYILNCCHPEYNLVKILNQENFRFDLRLMK
nr:RES family NAD+ phosphorylase [Bacteroidota bacterium]